VGATLTVGLFNGVKAVDVIATTKGCGFQGVMKRWGFGGMRASPGTKKVHRQQDGTGGMAANRGGGRHKKGKKLAGQYGNERVTTRNIQVLRVDEGNGLLLIHGAVPGPAGGMVIIRETNKF